MSDDPSRDPEAPRETPESDSAGRSAVDDLTAGLGLVLSAARKVMQGVEPKKIEELGRRTFSRFDRQRVEELGRKAKQTLDPRRMEELAEDAGRELVRAVERVAERMESILNVPGEPQQSEPQATESKSDDAAASQEGGPNHPKVRVKDE